jgi:hypothetical protein
LTALAILAFSSCLFLMPLSTIPNASNRDSLTDSQHHLHPKIITTSSLSTSSTYQDPTQVTMEGEPYTTYHAGGGTTFMVPASPQSLIREVTGDLFDAPEGSGLIRKSDYPLSLYPFR